MRASAIPAAAVVMFLLTTGARAECEAGAYGTAGDFVVIVPPSTPSQAGQRYLFLDGRRGNTRDRDAPVLCKQGAVEVRGATDASVQWPKIPLQLTDTKFSSLQTQLTGRLLEPAKSTSESHPLVVMVHGSERTSALVSPYPYVLAAQGVSVFVYDKRGTGESAGEYTQNFELLAADAAAALSHAKAMTRGRASRVGYFGGSQGGWVAPLAATKAPADFIAIGFGLITSPIQEDREQLLSEGRALRLTADSMGLLERLSAATARLLRSDFEEGYEELARVRRDLQSQSWARRIQGEYSGDMLRSSEEELRRYGPARFDNLELMWDYDSTATLSRLNAPILWVLAGEDREAPIETTRAALLDLIHAGKAIDVYVFPQTDHGMFEFIAHPDGTRTATRITDGYLRLVADWIKGRTSGSYGRAEKLSGG